MAPPTPSPPSELLREKPRGSREQPQPSVGCAIVQRNVGHWEGREREGLEERRLCQQDERCSGMDLTSGVFEKKKEIQIYQIYFYSSKTSVALQDLD